MYSPYKLLAAAVKYQALQKMHVHLGKDEGVQNVALQRRWPHALPLLYKLHHGLRIARLPLIGDRRLDGRQQRATQQGQEGVSAAAAQVLQRR